MLNCETDTTFMAEHVVSIPGK